MRFDFVRVSRDGLRRRILAFLLFWTASLVLVSLSLNEELYALVRTATTGDLPDWLIDSRRSGMWIVAWNWSNLYRHPGEHFRIPFEAWPVVIAAAILAVSALFLLRREVNVTRDESGSAASKGV